MPERRGARRAGRLAAAILAAAAATIPAAAQVRPGSARTAPAPNLPAPDERTSLKLLYGIMAAVDQANRTGNYSVLRDLGTSAFQANNDQAALTAAFAGLRGQNADLSETLMATPVWEIPPRLTSPTVLRMRGSFPLRPLAVGFDLLFAWDRGWRLDSIAVRATPPPR